MLNRFISSILIVTSSFVLAWGQEKKAEDGDKAPRAFSFMFDGGGSWLGVQTDEVTKDNYSKYNLSGVRGVAVEKVSENSPAAAAGILAGDVILKLDGEEVTGVRKLTRLVSEVDPDHQVRITISRGGREQEITATLAKRPAPKFEEGNFTFPPMGNFDFKNMPDLKSLPRVPMAPGSPDAPNAPQVWSFPGGEGRSFMWKAGEGRMIGVGVTPLSKQLADHYGVQSGVLVSEVRDNSAAAKAGLRAGDIITEVNGKPIKGQFDIIKLVNEKKDGDVSVTFVRDGKRQTVNVTPEKSKENGFVFDTDDGDNG